MTNVADHQSNCSSPPRCFGAEASLARYLDETAKKFNDDWKRVPCGGCGASRHIYCPDCLKILLPKEDEACRWPQSILDGTLRMPFNVDIVFDDRRAVSSGIQFATILNEVQNAAASNAARGSSDCDVAQPNAYRLYDVAVDGDDAVPSYNEGGDCDGGEENDGTYLLFPGPNSVPLSSILNNNIDCSEPAIKRLVVLDCKWRRSSIRLHTNLKTLRQVHLDDAHLSFYWRWHNSGEGNLSTLEAIYYAALQVDAFTRKQSQQSLRCSGVDDLPLGVATVETSERNQNSYLLDLFWLFALQRETIRRSYENGSCKDHPAPVPFTEVGKEYHRALRRKNKQNKKKKSRQQQSNVALK